VDHDPLPPPGTLADLLNDAAGAGWPTNERMLRDWTTKGLLGSPARQSLGKGHGQAPALYSSKQRALFGDLVALRRRGAHPDQLAKAVVYAWLYHDDEYVDTRQALAAARIAVGDPKKSRRMAAHTAKALVDSININRELHDIPSGLSHDLRDKITDQLNKGPIDPRRLRPAVSAIFDAGGLAIVRGPDGAQFSTDVIVATLATRARGATLLARATRTLMDKIRQELRTKWLQYSSDRPQLHALASDDIKHAYSERSLTRQVDGAIFDVLFMVGRFSPRNPPAKQKQAR
jgi:hypothetical protein